MITDCGSPIEACGAFESLVDKLWDIGRDTGQHFLHQINTQQQVQLQQPGIERTTTSLVDKLWDIGQQVAIDITTMSIYTGDKDKRRRSNSDKYMWIVITTCNIIFAIYLLQYKAPATPCTSSSNPIIIAKNTTQLPFYLARSQSFGFFYDISNDHWRLYRDIQYTY